MCYWNLICKQLLMGLMQYTLLMASNGFLSFLLQLHQPLPRLLPPFLPSHGNIIRSPHPSQLCRDGLALTISLAAHITAALQSNCHPQVDVFLVLAVYLQAPHGHSHRVDGCRIRRHTCWLHLGIIRHDPRQKGREGRSREWE